MNEQQDAARVVIISGATKGLGRALALTFAHAGYYVVGLYRTDRLAAQTLAREFAALHLAGQFIEHDVTREAAGEFWPAAGAPASAHLTLLNNACAPFTPLPLHLLTWDDFQAGLDVAVKGSLLCTRAVLRDMLKARRGTVVNVLTTAIEGLPPKGFAAYVTAKFALQGLTRALASEYAPRGVRIFSVAPGFMETPLTASWEAHLRAAVAAASPTGPQSPLHVAEAIRQLVENPAIPGQGENYIINGDAAKEDV